MVTGFIIHIGVETKAENINFPATGCADVDDVENGSVDPLVPVPFVDALLISQNYVGMMVEYTYGIFHRSYAAEHL